MLIALVKLLSRTVSALPLPAALALGRGLGAVVAVAIRYHRRDAVEALRLAMPQATRSQRRRLVLKMYENLGMNVVETLRLEHIDDSELRKCIQWEGEEHMQPVLARGKGLLVLSAHMGHWDLLCTIAPRLNYPTTIITKNLRNTKLNDYWMSTRARFGLKFVPAHNSYRQCLSALRKNEIVGFILDQNMIRDEGVFVSFMGRPACTSPGLAYMSAQSGAAVVPVFMIRLAGGRHLIKVLPPIPPPPDRKPQTVLAYTQQYTKVIEDMVLQHPDQWIWIHRRWRTRPPDAEAVPVPADRQQSA